MRSRGGGVDARHCGAMTEQCWAGPDSPMLSIVLRDRKTVGGHQGDRNTGTGGGQGTKETLSGRGGSTATGASLLHNSLGQGLLLSSRGIDLVRSEVIRLNETQVLA